MTRNAASAGIALAWYEYLLPAEHNNIRRLTPLECCRLQGFPDWWEEGVEGSDTARMKAAGVKAGVPDMFLPVARGGSHGLYIELKRIKGGRVSAEQLAWMEELTREGYTCAVCHGWEEARKVIQTYLKGGGATCD